MADKRMKREGSIRFSDAALYISEEGLSGDLRERDIWCRNFKRDVFLRIVQQLNRLGWKCEVPARMIREHSLQFAQHHRYCRKGDLQADLSVMGRCIELKMFQCVNAPNRPDHDGRYEPNKEAVMPYLLRLEMERTRRRIKTYLCNVFSDYHFVEKGHDGRAQHRGPGGLTALEWVAGCYATSCHFKGDTSKHPISIYNCKAADDTQLEHLQRVWGFDYKGRVFSGIAYYNINNMWWVVTGRYDVRNEASFRLHTTPPENPRLRRNARLRRARLEQELAKAVSAMDFRRAETLRDLIWPPGEQLYMVWHKDHKAFHGPNFSGYYADEARAGKFTLDECKGWAVGENVLRPLPQRTTQVVAHG
jgi:hypothetical protein